MTLPVGGRCDATLGAWATVPSSQHSLGLLCWSTRRRESARQLVSSLLGPLGPRWLLVPVPPLGVVGVPCWNPLPRALYPPADGDGGTHVWKARLFSSPPPSSSTVDCSEFRGLR